MNERTNLNDGAFPDELISAYLDDELSPAEKLRVEEQLMDSAEHRQLFEELKALRRGMQSLPQQTLGADFAARVLERAEKQLLADDEPADTKTTAPKPTAAKSVSTSDDRGAWRGLIWSVAAMAAAIMLIVFSPWLTNERNINHRGVAVNQGPEDPPKAANAINPGEGKLVKDHGEQGETVQRVDTNGTTGQEVGAKDGVRSGGIQLDNSAGQSISVGRGSEATDLQQANEGQRNQLADLDGAGAGFAGDVARKSRDNVELASRPPQPELTDGLRANFSRFQQMHNARDGEPAQNRDRLDAAEQLAADMMVVSVDVTPEALSEHFLDEMLAKHNIRTNRAEDELAKASVAPDFAELKNEKSKQDDLTQQDQQLGAAPAASELQSAGGQAPSDDRDTKALEQLRVAELESLRRQRTDKEAGKARTAQGDVDVMVVVATPEQIDGLLSDMRSQSQYVLAMASDRPMVATKKSQTALSYRSPSDTEEQLKQLAEDKARRTDTLEDRLKGNVRGNAITTSEPQEKELAPDVGAEDGSAFADRASGGGEGATAPTNLVNTPLDPKYNDFAVGQKQAEDYRGIARRLHLPENFQKDLAPANKQFANSADQYALPVAPFSQGIVQQGQGGGQSHGGDFLPTNNAPEDVHGEGPNVASRGGGFAAKREEQPLVRVLFVLRATNTAPTAAAKPAADSLPGADVPANAALKEAAVDAVPAASDE